MDLYRVWYDMINVSENAGDKLDSSSLLIGLFTGDDDGGAGVTGSWLVGGRD